MKNILKFSLFLLIVLSAGSCIKETFPKGSTVTQEQLQQSEEAVAYMLSGIPSAMTNSGTAGYYATYGFHGDFGISAIHFATEAMLEDLAVLGELGYFWFSAYYQNIFQGADYWLIAFFWDQYYEWIKLANDIINVVGEVDDDTTEETKNILGQAYTYRAMCYLDLARMYAPKPNKILMPSQDILNLTVPIVTEKTTELQARNNPRATREEMYKFILSDLEKALEYLKNGQITYTEPNEIAIYGLLARTYLELGATYKEMGNPIDWDLTSDKAYEEAAKYARMAIDKGYHTPLDDLQWIDPVNGFNNGSSNDAWIWGLTTSSENVSNLIANIAHRSCEALYGYGNLYYPAISQALYSRISDEDFRKLSWYDPDSDFFYELAGNGYISEPYFIYDGGYGFEAKKHMSLKFRPAGGNVFDYTAGNSADWCLMRIEEMYFIEMEAELEVSGLGKAQTLLNHFMQTYRYKSYNCTLVTMTPEAFLNEMMLQKRIEFWGEGILFYDYKRLNMGITRGYTGTNIPDVATFNCEGRSPQWNFMITRGEYQSNKVIAGQNNPDPTEKLVLWK